MRALRGLLSPRSAPLLVPLLFACAPVGPIAHRPELLRRLPLCEPEPPTGALPAPRRPPLTVLLPQNLSSYPNGALYNDRARSIGALYQTFSVAAPEYPLLEGLYRRLRLHGHDARKDYDPGRVPGPAEPPALACELLALEIATVQAAPAAGGLLTDAARARLRCHLRGAAAAQPFAVAAAVKLARDAGDVLRELALRIGDRVHDCLGEGLCEPPPPLDQPEPWDDLESRALFGAPRSEAASLGSAQRSEAPSLGSRP